MPDFAVGPVTVRVSATSANLGPGFDSLGLCLDLADLVSAEVTTSGTEVVVTGEGAGQLPEDDTHLVMRSLRSAFDGWGVGQPGLRLVCRNSVPQGCGLGSSAAAIVGGLRLAEALVPGQLVTESEALTFTAEIEGHADNVAACLLGGLTIAWVAGDRPAAVRLEVDPRVVPVVFCADRPMSTSTARGLLPAIVPHQEAAANSAHSALLVTALTSRPDLLLPATQDYLHQEARRASAPQSMALVDALRANGVPAVISGAGPSVLALCTADQAAEMLVTPRPAGWRVMRLPVDPRGASVVPGGPAS